MGRKLRAAARCCLVLNLLLSVVAAVVALVGLAGTQKACSAEYEQYSMAISMPETNEAASSDVYGGSSSAEGPSAVGDYDTAVEGAEAPQAEEAAVAAEWSTLASQNVTVGEMPDWVANLSSVVRNTTQSRLESFLARLSNSTSARLDALLNKRSRGFLDCAKRYSLPWWAWVSQLLVIILSTIVMCSGKCGKVMALPVLLYTATVVVLDMVVCHWLFDSIPFGYSYYAYSSSFSSTQTWSGVALAGFIMACISNYCLLFCAPLLTGSPTLHKKKVDSEEESRSLASAADS